MHTIFSGGEAGLFLDGGCFQDGTESDGDAGGDGVWLWMGVGVRQDLGTDGRGQVIS